MPPEAISSLAFDYAAAERAQLCWTLGITEHHNGVDNVLALINLALLTGHVGRHGSGLTPLRGQNNVQGGGDMGAIPNKLPGFHDIERDPTARHMFESAWGVPIPSHYGMHLTQMFHAMDKGELTTLYCIGENPAQSEADSSRTHQRLQSLDCLVVQDIFLTKTAEMADIVLPASSSWCESEGTVRNSERRVHRVRRALSPPGEARDDLDILSDLAARLGYDWGRPSPQQVWDELRSLSPVHRGMSYARLEALGGIAWPCYDEQSVGEAYLHGRLWERDLEKRGSAAPFTVVFDDPPLDPITPEFPLRLTTGRRLDSYNTGVQTSAYASPLRFGERLDISPEDASNYGLKSDDRVRIVSRRGAIEAVVNIDPGLREGLVFMTFHFSEDTDVNILTNEASDPRSGTSEFKAASIRIEAIVSKPCEAGG